MTWFVFFIFVFFKQKTAYEIRISDWSSDVCSSDLPFEEPCFIEYGTGDDDGDERGCRVPDHVPDADHIAPVNQAEGPASRRAKQCAPAYGQVFRPGDDKQQGAGEDAQGGGGNE